MADTITPVSVYLRVRDKFPSSILLESSDHQASENAFSYICFNPIASIKVENGAITRQFPDQLDSVVQINGDSSVMDELQKFSSSFESEKSRHKFISNGLFGYISYDAVRYFEKIEVSNKPGRLGIPDIFYAIYQNIIVIDHFKSEAYIFCHSIEGSSNIDEISSLLQIRSFAEHRFERLGDAQTNVSDGAFMQLVSRCKDHCRRGDVFQIVPSKRFVQKFRGDEFNVYRSLRSINPSPYLFFFDYGNFKIFGSSPEAQLVIKDRKAEIHPIAGTVKRTSDDLQDAEQAKLLNEDKKETSEHVMLVDLARNDLSRNARDVSVEKFREVQYFSHVIHLVSKVSGEIKPEIDTFRVVADTFPAGTLSGAPKYKAMTLLEQYENVNREFYGGAIGFMSFDGDFNHAIIIRSFVSKDHHLYYQAGAGVVADSKPESELNEVYNKLRALEQAMDMAEEIN